MKLLLSLLLSIPAAAQPSHLDDQGFAPQLVELKDSSVIVTAIPPVVVSGTVPVSATIVGTVPVSGVFFQTTQPVSGPLTDAQLRASSVPVSGAFFQATQPVSIVGSTVSAVSVFPSPRIYSSSAPIVLSDTSDTSLVSLSYDGEIEAIMFNFDRSQVIVSVVVDGTEQFRSELASLVTLNEFNLGDGASTAGAFPIVVARGGKQFMLRFSSPKRIASSLAIKARRTVAGATNMVGAAVVYGVNP